MYGNSRILTFQHFYDYELECVTKKQLINVHFNKDLLLNSKRKNCVIVCFIRLFPGEKGKNVF